MDHIFSVSPSENLQVFKSLKVSLHLSSPCSIPTRHLSCFFRHKYYLVASFKTYLDGKPYKIDYALCPRDAPGTVEVCRTVCPFTKWSQTAILFQTLCLFSIIFCHLSAANLLCLLHFPQILTHKMSLLKINFCFWKSEIARILTITIHFLTQEFKVHTQ